VIDAPSQVRIRRRTFRFKVTEPGYEDLSDEQIRRMIALAPRSRDGTVTLADGMGGSSG
jgi:hypothetical protein